MNPDVSEIKKIEEEYRHLVLEMTKLQIQQQKILSDYTKKLRDIRLAKIRKQF
jgi:uncharacterized iron-regulated protein